MNTVLVLGYNKIKDLLKTKSRGRVYRNDTKEMKNNKNVHIFIRETDIITFNKSSTYESLFNFQVKHISDISFFFS